MTSVERVSSFFPHSKSHLKSKQPTKAGKAFLKRNDESRMTELNNITKHDAKVTIPKAVRDFSRIKKAVDSAPEINNSDKIANLKKQIQNKTYNVNYEAIADKILQTEF